MGRDIAEIRRDIEGTRGRLRDTAEAIGWKADVPARARDVLRETAAVVRERVASGQTSSRDDDGGPSLARRIGDVASSVGDTVGSATHAVTDTVGAAGSAVASTASAAGEKVSSAGSAVAGSAASARESVVGRAGSAADSAGSVTEGVREHMPSARDARQGVSRAAGTARANPVAVAAGALALGAIAGMLLPSTRTEDEHLGPLADEVKGRGAEVAQEAMEKGREVVGEAGEQIGSAARGTGES